MDHRVALASRGREGKKAVLAGGLPAVSGGARVRDRLGVDGGRSGQQLGGGGGVGDAPPRRHGAVAEQLGASFGCSTTVVLGQRRGSEGGVVMGGGLGAAFIGGRGREARGW